MESINKTRATSTHSHTLIVTVTIAWNSNPLAGFLLVTLIDGSSVSTKTDVGAHPIDLVGNLVAMVAHRFETRNQFNLSKQKLHIKHTVQMLGWHCPNI